MNRAGNYNISINQLADFSKGTEAKKRAIIRQQKNPNPLKVFWYQLAKARIKKSISERGDLEPILLGIDELKTRQPKNKRQATDRNVSVEAMERYIKMQIPNLLKDYEYEILKRPKIKSILINGVELIVSPDLVLKLHMDGVDYIGGVKIHISKHNTFDGKQQSYVASAVHRYLETIVAKDEQEVLPELCLSIDIFRGSLVSAPTNIDERIRDIEVICEEVKKMWYAA